MKARSGLTCRRRAPRQHAGPQVTTKDRAAPTASSSTPASPASPRMSTCLTDQFPTTDSLSSVLTDQLAGVAPRTLL